MSKKITLQQRIYVFLILLAGLGAHANAQVTLILPNASTSNHASIAAAYTAINFGTNPGAHVIQLESAYDPSLETYPITFAAKSGASATNNITVRPASGVKKVIGPANRTVTATVTASTFTSASTSVDLSSIITTGDISYLAGNVAASDISITTTTGSATATITSGTLTNGTYYVSGNANIPARRTFTYSGSSTITLNSGTSVTAGTAVASKATPTTNSFVSGIGTYTTLDFYNISSISGNTITVPSGTFTANSINGNKLYVGPILTRAILFSGASYVTIDGVSRTDPSTGLTIQNPNLIYANTIYFNSGTYNTVKNCIIRGANQTGSHNNGFCGQIFFNGGSFNTVTQNEISDIDGSPLPVCMVTFNNSTANNTVSFNNMYNIGTELSPNGNAGFFQFPSSLSGSNNNVLNNKMFWTKAVKFTRDAYLVGAGGSMTGTGHRIENNVIGYGASDGTGTASLSAVSSLTTLLLSGITPKNATVVNNTIGGINASCQKFYGIQLLAHSATSTPTVDTYCFGNQIKDITVASTANGAFIMGIENNISAALDINIKNNIIRNISLTSTVAANTCNVQGLTTAGAAHVTNVSNYSGNQIYNLTAGLAGTTTAANLCYGMRVGANARLVEKNLVYDIFTPNAAGNIRGIEIVGSNAVGTTFQNNVIRLATGTATASAIAAFYQNAATAAGHPMYFYHNSVYIGGTSTAQPTAIVNRFTTHVPNLTFKNNIFSNKRSGNSYNNMIYSLTTLASVVASANNLYEYSLRFAQISSPSAVNYATLAEWNTARTTATLSTDDNSINQTSPQFMDPTATIPDLRIIASSNVVDQVGDNLAATVADDYDGKTRSGFTAHDLGAFAYTVTTPATLANHHFKTLASGNWRTNSTWQSSADGSTNWITATAFPSAAASSIAIQNDHSVIVAAEATAPTLTIDGGGELTLNERVRLTATNLSLLSDATNGTATLVDNNAAGGLTVSGTSTVNQNLTSSRRTWYMSSPVVGAQPTANVDRIRHYNEANNSWSTLYSTGADAQTPVAYGSNVFEMGKGYLVVPSAGGNIAFTGALNAGEKTISLQKTDGIAKTGFNLIGNPYPSYLDWKAVYDYSTDGGLTHPNRNVLVDGTMWYRTKVEVEPATDPVTYEYKFWTVNGEGVGSVAGATKHIPPMQAFWVRAKTIGSESLILNKDMRSHGEATNKLLKAPAAKNTAMTLLRLQVSNGANTDEAVIYFSANASNGKDAYDAPKMSNNNPAIPEIYTSLGTEKIVINGMNSIPMDQEIGLGFTAGNANSFSLKAIEMSNLPSDVKVIVKDNVTGTETDMTDGMSSYEFRPMTTTDNRFSLIFRTAGATTGIENEVESKILVYSTGNNQITIVLKDDLQLGSTVSVYNAVGQKLLSKQITSTVTHIPGNFTSGVYMVKMNNKTSKIVVK